MNIIKNEDAKAFGTMLIAAAHISSQKGGTEFDLDEVVEAKYGEEKAKVLAMFGPAPVHGVSEVQAEGEQTEPPAQ